MAKERTRLSEIETRFVRAYLTNGFHGRNAALTAGYSIESAYSTAFVKSVLARPSVAAYIERKKLAFNEAADLKPLDVVRQLVQVMRGDPNELVQHRRVACRHCHGELHFYQYRPQEMRDAYAAHIRSKEYLDEGIPFDMKGGDGYRGNLDPHPDCPECDGRGIEQVHIADTRDLSPEAATLYNGVEQTKNGIKVNMRSKDSAVQMAARYLGMDKLNLLLGTSNAKDLTDEQLADIIKQREADGE